MLMKRLAQTFAVSGVIAVAAALSFLWANPVWAHNSLVEASPAKEAALTEPPSEVKLRFLASLQPDTKLTVVDAEGESAIGEVTIEGKIISAPFLATAGGVYTVGYELTASDGHTTKKTYTFTVTVEEEPVVLDPSPTPTEEPAATATPVAAASQGGEDTPWWPYIGGAALAGLIVGGVITFVRNRSHRA